MATTTPDYELFYWPTIQGRGEFVRLVLEEAGLPYDDVARRPETEGGGIAALLGILEDDAAGTPPFAPPVLRLGGLRIAQTALICRYVAEQCGLAPTGQEDRLRADQIMLTIMDRVLEAHDTHHPISGMLYYEEQRAEALRRLGHQEAVVFPCGPVTTPRHCCWQR